MSRILDQNMRRLVITTLLLLTAAFSNAQIISDWNDDSGIISSWSQEQETVHGWDETLEEFSETEDNLKGISEHLAVSSPERSVTDSLGLPPIGKKTIRINGKEVSVPSIMMDGIDLYMLLEEGINIYMAANPPAFYEEIDYDTIRWIRYYAYSKREYTKRIFKRYDEWQRYVSLTMQSESVPPELGLLCLIESGCTYTAVSNKGATGMWQFMPATAREMGLEVSPYRDQRTDPIESTRAAAKYLKNAYKNLGNWTMAAASYNCGTGRTGKIIDSHGTKEWGKIKENFPKETRQYIPALMAIHYVWTYRKDFRL